MTKAKFPSVLVYILFYLHVRIYLVSWQVCLRQQWKDPYADKAGRQDQLSDLMGKLQKQSQGRQGPNQEGSQNKQIKKALAKNNKDQAKGQAGKLQVTGVTGIRSSKAKAQKKTTLMIWQGNNGIGPVYAVSD